MAITNRQLSARAQKHLAMIDALPPKKFPTVINPHVFNPSTVADDKTCLACGLQFKHKLHITKHHFSHNPDSTLGRCICGLSSGHPVHYPN